MYKLGILEQHINGRISLADKLDFLLAYQKVYTYSCIEQHSRVNCVIINFITLQLIASCTKPFVVDSSREVERCYTHETVDVE